MRHTHLAIRLYRSLFIAVVVPDATPYAAARQIEERLIDAVMDWDAAHGTFTLCLAGGSTRWPVEGCTHE